MANCGASVRDGKAARASRVGHRGRLPIIIEVGSGRGRRSRVYESTRQGAYSKTGLVGSAGMSAIPRFADPKSDIALGPISANERTRSAGGTWRRGRAITSAAVTI